MGLPAGAVAEVHGQRAACAIWPPVQCGHPCNMATRAIWPHVRQELWRKCMASAPLRAVRQLREREDAANRAAKAERETLVVELRDAITI